MVKVIWTQRSLNDLKDIIEYISKDSPKYASITAERLIKAVYVSIVKFVDNPLKLNKQLQSAKLETQRQQIQRAT